MAGSISEARGLGTELILRMAVRLLSDAEIEQAVVGQCELAGMELDLMMGPGVSGYQAAVEWAASEESRLSRLERNQDVYGELDEEQSMQLSLAREILFLHQARTVHAKRDPRGGRR